MVTVQLDTDNAAFADSDYQEVARILRVVADYFAVGRSRVDGNKSFRYVLRDINGNPCGTVAFDPDINPGLEA